MLVKLVGTWAELTNLQESVKNALEELKIADFVSVETTSDAAYSLELWITANPALCIEEPNIEFKDMIFEGTIPEKQELVSMFASIFGIAQGGDSCGTGGGCSDGGCSGCSC